MLEILLVDDEPATRLSVASALTDSGHRVHQAADGAEALALVDGHVFDVAICDVRLPKVDGLTVFRHLRRESPGTAVILMTAYATIADAVTALREGAFDYVTKPFDCEEFSLRVIGRIAERRTLRRDLEEARAKLVAREVGAAVVGSSPVMVRLLEQLDTIAQSDANVLVTGEPGTGKELIAHTLHVRSARRLGPFVQVPCGPGNDDALDVELFGTTSVGVTSRDGKLRAAEGGTLHLGEVADLPMAIQAKLARVLKEGAIDVGAGEAARVDARIVSSTERDLRELVAQGKFREDLLYCLNVIDVALPPLRERRGDLLLLLQHFLRLKTPPGKVPPGISTGAWAALASYPFPGNVRELAHAVERALVLAHGSEIEASHLPPEILAHAASDLERTPVKPLSVAMKAYERQYLLRVLQLTGGDRARAAELLVISKKTLSEKLRLHDLEDGALAH